MKEKKLYQKWWVWLIAIIVISLGIYLIMNPNWFTKPKYMLNSQYCEQDGDCIKGGKTCSPFNKFAVNKNYDCDSSGIVFCNPSSSCDIVYLRAEDE